MNISDFLITMAQTTEVEQPGLFPFPFVPHLIFCCLALVFFIFRFIKQKCPYQLIMAVAIPFTLVIWVGRKVFYGVGIVELILTVSAVVTSIIFKKKEPVKETTEGTAGETTEETEAEEENEREEEEEEEENEEENEEKEEEE